MENLEIGSAQRVAELKYRGQVHTSKRLNSAQTQAEVEMQSEFVGTVASTAGAVPLFPLEVPPLSRLRLGDLGER